MKYEWGYKKPSKDGYIEGSWYKIEPSSKHAYYSVLTRELILGPVWTRTVVHANTGKSIRQYASEDDILELRLRGEA